MISGLTKHIEQKKAPFERMLQFNYAINKTLSFFGGNKSSLSQKSVENLIYEVDNMGHLLNIVYGEAKALSEEEAKQIFPHITSIRCTIADQKRRFSSINYANSQQARKKFYRLTRIANRLEARVQKRASQNAEPIATPGYIKDKMKQNNRKALKNALR
jgi:hypothetical protein